LIIAMSIFAKAAGFRTYIGLASLGVAAPSYRTRTLRCEGSVHMDLSTSTNPLLQKKSLPLFQDINSVHVKPALAVDLEALKKDFSVFESRLDKGYVKPVDFSTVVEELEVIQAPLSYSWGVVGHLMGVKNSDDLRKSHDLLQPAIVETYQKIGQSQPVFKALTSIRNDSELWDKLTESQQRIIISSIRGMETSGVGLEPNQRENFNKLKLELAELSTKFSNNVLDSTKSFKLTLTEKKDVEGLPDSAKAFAAQQAVSAGFTEANKEDGPWLLTLDMPSYLPSMQHLKNREIREKLYRAYVTRASQGDNDNAPIIKRILQIKTECCRLLGYNCYAEQSLAAKMAPSIDKVL